MRLSNLADYAVVLLAAAVRAGDGRLNATCLAEETGVPLPTAQKLVGKLATAGLLVSSRGTGGGFRLARPASEISLADIVEAVEGPIALTACVEAGKQDCGLDHSCKVRPHWEIVNDAMRKALADVSLIALAQTPVRPEPVEGLSFSLTKQDGTSTSSVRTVLEVGAL
ncbi:SUF system Fe-S cluster assembly regulator [Sphingomonas sp. BIUV-7]|uniref:SUF system Fe-S cluster assembly regulator n=1 Tax=Sphingomonas natans TaxID=3063330 RepID=A0ABT8YE80_9SPHN|nr:SUF system Fe-S cluster assembly regulator [Sphingomonas sp. BIUV-7]MDO6416675.1 SUF system Fe-S cluster assembly regulator [Sphingomonas sp. BIUV-7]